MRSLLCQTNSLLRKHTKEDINLKILKRLIFGTDEFDKLCHDARLIVAHAGMGTIISAMTKGKPIIVFPRIAALGEHRNEHQLATSKNERTWICLCS